MEQALVIFGATISTAKEAFVINLPPKSLYHSVQNHSESLQSVTRQVIMLVYKMDSTKLHFDHLFEINLFGCYRTIISSTEYFDVNCTELKPTNMYVMLKSKVHIGEEYFQQHDSFKLPSTCRTTVLNVENHSDEMALKCCQNLVVYDDMEESTNSADFTIEKTEDSNYGEISKNGHVTQVASSNDLKFYECNIVVKGFKNQLVKGKSIWTK